MLANKGKTPGASILSTRASETITRAQTYLERTRVLLAERKELVGKKRARIGSREHLEIARESLRRHSVDLARMERVAAEARALLEQGQARQLRRETALLTAAL